jgi:hypothetical protein
MAVTRLASYDDVKKYGAAFVDVHYNPYLRRYVVIWQQDRSIRGHGTSIDSAHWDLYKCAVGVT